MRLLVDLTIIAVLLFGIRMFRQPPDARKGNGVAAAALGMAFLLVLYRYEIVSPTIVLIALLIGSAIGWAVAMRVNMIQIPAMVAFQHGAGGVAAFLVSFVELTRAQDDPALVGQLSGALGLIIGAFTFSGSMIASAKLANRINQRPVVLKRHSLLLLIIALLVAILAAAMPAFAAPQRAGLLLVLIALAIALGAVFSIRIGGADMPVLISLLNATAGLAAALCGVIIQNRLLIACGATVAASGSILTHVMCKAMNRSLLNIFTGIKPALAADSAAPPPVAVEQAASAAAQAPPPAAAIPEAQDPFAAAAEALRAAASVVIIPGYGMALAQAQFRAVRLAGLLERQGRRVRFAVHPVAGRMPGHMNVLLAEADVDYDNLVEMDEINPAFKETDVALVIGACDVVNPAAIAKAGTPISGMPILLAHEAKRTIVCNLDARPGYSGVDNPLFGLERTTMLLGDAKQSLDALIKLLE